MCKVYVELNDSSERLDLSYAEIQKMIESFNIPVESISHAMYVEKENSSYKRMSKFFKKLFNDANKNEN